MYAIEGISSRLFSSARNYSRSVKLGMRTVGKISGLGTANTGDGLPTVIDVGATYLTFNPIPNGLSSYPNAPQEYNTYRSGKSFFLGADASTRKVS